MERKIDEGWVFREVSVKVVGHKWSLEKWEECGQVSKRAFQERGDRKRSAEAEMLRVYF